MPIGSRVAVIAGVLAVAVAARVAGQAEERVAPVPVTGIVFHDRNGNGARDPGEPGIAGARISDQITTTTSDGEGRFSFLAGGYGVVFVTHPTGFSARGPVWRRVEAGRALEFPLTARSSSPSFTFIHASDTHISPANVERTRRLRALVDSLQPAFVLISGDLIRDALRVGEAQATAENELFDREIAAFPVPIYPVPGNHDIFAIERHRSLVGTDHPRYGKRMYRSFRGPNYYSFDWGGIHFIGFDTVDFWDLSYFGRVDSAQVGWLARDLAATPAGMPVVTFNHIPFVSGAPSIDGFDDESVAPTVIRVDGRSWFRHTVQNTDTIMALLGDRLAIALGGHFHRRELLHYETARGFRRFAQAAAVTTPVRGPGQLGVRSGITLYRVTNGKVDDGVFVAME